MGGAVFFSILGPLEVYHDDERVQVNGPKRRALLLYLILHANEVVATDRIIDALWQGELSGKEDATLRVHISHLRGVLEPERENRDTPSIIEHVGAGYVLLTEPGSTDTEKFDQLARDGRNAADTDQDLAVGLFQKALDLWRGNPLEDVRYENYAQDEIRRLTAARLDVVEDRAGALLIVGRHVEVISELESVVKDNPTRERATELLMLALYRAGRQADALRAYQGVNQLLGQERGLDVGPQLRQLEQQILTHDPQLQLSPSASPTIDTTPLGPGRAIRGYELRERIGEGHFGHVFRAYQPAIGREVAVKAIRPEFTDNPEFIDRFHTEAQVVAQLEHPHIVPLYDYWREPAGAYLVMRWLRGGSLEASLMQGPWSESALADVVTQMCDALAAAHTRGVIHRDIKPANVLFDDDRNAYISDFGIAVDAIDQPGGLAGSAGTLRAPYASPEILRNEPASPQSDVYSTGVLIHEMLTGRSIAQDPSYDPLRVDHQPLPDPDNAVGEALREVITVATSERPSDRYPDAVTLANAVDRAVSRSRSEPRVKVLRRNPYKGLNAFQESDTADFYGRTELVESLSTAVLASPLVTVVGPSGSGKSSLIRAGLIPHLRTHKPDTKGWQVITMSPGRDPFGEFHTALRPLTIEGRHDDHATDSDTELQTAIAEGLNSENHKVLLVIDQFEELFTTTPERDRTRFLENLTRLAKDARSRVHIVVALRADFYDRPLALRGFGELVASGSFSITPLTPEELERAIVGPAERSGVDLEPGLVAEIVGDVANEPGALPLLQYALTELFDARSHDTLTVRSYRDLGGVTGALGRRADDVYRSLTNSQQVAARSLFLRMITVGDVDMAVTRRRVSLTELRTHDGQTPPDSVLQPFVDARLITLDRDPVSRTPTAELAHEAIISSWDRLTDWIHDSADDLRLARNLAAATGVWVQANRDPSYLLTGSRLSTYEVWAGSPAMAISASEQDLITASVAAREQDVQTQIDRAANEVGLERRSRRRLIYSVVGAVAVVVFGLLAVVALNQRQAATEIAGREEQTSTARELAAASLTNLDVDPELALLLAIESANTTAGTEDGILPESVDALHNALVTPTATFVIPGARPSPFGSSVAWVAEGAAIAYVTDTGDIAVVNAFTGEEVTRLAAGVPDVLMFEISTDTGLIVTLGVDGVLRTWDGTSQEQIAQVDGGGQISVIAVSEDGASIAAGLNDGSVEIRDGTSLELRRTIAAHSGTISALDFNRTGDAIATGATDGRSATWDVPSGDKITDWNDREQSLSITGVSFHPSGRWWAASTIGGRISLIDATTGLEVSSYSDGQFQSVGVSFGSASFLVAPGRDGIARVWGTASPSTRAIVLAGHRGAVFDAALDPSETAVATVGSDGTLRIWRDYFGAETTFKNHSNLDNSTRYSPDGTLVASSGNSSPSFREVPVRVVVYDTESDDVVGQYPIGAKTIAFTPDSDGIAVVGEDGSIEIVDISTGQVDVAIPSGAQWANDLAFSPQGSLLAGAGFAGTAAIWDTSTGDTIATLAGHGDRLAEAGGVAPTLSEGLGFLNLYTAQRVSSVAFSPDGDTILTTGFDGTARLWDRATWQQTSILEGHTTPVTYGAFSPDGSQIATADDSGRVLLWDAATGEQTGEMERVAGSIARIVFSPDGARIAGAGPGRTAYLWDVSLGTVDRRLSGAFFSVSDVDFSPDGATLMVGSVEGVSREYALVPGDLLEFATSSATRKLTDDECARYLHRPCSDRSSG